MKPLRTLFVIADGARARWVRRSEAADDFVTFRELDAAPAGSHGARGGAFTGPRGQRYAAEESHGAQEHDRQGFARTIAEAINHDAARGDVERLALVAPARLLAAIRGRLGPQASASLVHTLDKDLTKAPDHALGDWLRPLERG